MKTENSTKISNKKSKTKKIDCVKTSLKESIRDLSLFKFKSGVVVALVLFVIFGLLNSLFEIKVVAKLPFKSIRIVMKMSHKGLQGDDSTDCSMAFLYFLCSISIRTNLQKFLGFSLPRGAAAAGYSWVSTIIHVDYPEQWPHLIDLVKHNLQQNQQVCGALFVLWILLENVINMGT
ncbi:hypothetical protein LWI28_003799 [Acer negundo]|uniref:Calcium load-activated calcium channel n=1 Tax=Acer negundo TaxID=4023 RepID=A0AAD5IL98_ACENE|nr:hypothetical protein LWI28_003799 [Acer negundo]